MLPWTAAGRRSPGRSGFPRLDCAVAQGLADCLRLLGLSLLVGIVASALSVRRVVSVDPMIAFANT